MFRYILRRLVALPVIMLGVTGILFALMLRIPLDQRVQIYLPATRPNPPEGYYERLVADTIKRRGLDQPLPVQYVRWLEGLVRGEWGYSPVWRQDALEGILARAPASAEVALAAMVPAVLLAIGLGTTASRYHRGWPDLAVRAVATLGWAFPPFILGLLFLNILYVWLGWFPPERLSIWAQPLLAAEGFHAVTGMHTVDALINGDLPLFWDALRHLGLPAVTLGVTQWALLTRVMRASMLSALTADHITTARSKGLPEGQVVRVHARRNALLPLISSAGVVASTMISGLIVVETIFSFGGLGRSAAAAIMQADIPVAVGFTLFSCLVVVLSSLGADILYAVVDPRVRTG